MVQKILSELKSHKSIYIALFAVLVIAGILRLWGLGHVPFVADEFLDVNATYGYHKTGQWQAWDFNHNEVSIRDNKASDERAWLYRMQVVFLYDHLPPTEFVVRLMSALWGIFTVFILYFVTWSFTRNRWIALIAAFLFSVSVSAIEINRKIRMYSMFAPIFLLFSWSVYHFLESRKERALVKVVAWRSVMQDALKLQYRYFLGVVLFGLMAYHLHPLAGNIALVIFAYFVVMFITKRKTSISKVYGVYILGILSLAVVVRFFVSDIWDQFMGSMVFFDDHWSYIGHILGNYWHPLLGAALMFFGGWHLIAGQEDKRPGIWIVINFCVILLAAIFLWNRNVGPQYIFFIQTFGFMLCAAGLYALAMYLRDALVFKRAFLIVIVLGALLLPAYDYFFQENNTYKITSASENPHYRNIFLYVKKYGDENDALITRNYRNYYWSGMDVSVFDFGSERSDEQLEKEGKMRKVTVDHLEKIMQEYSTGWVVYSDNDEKFITKEARAYFDANLIKIDDLQVRGNVSVYRWGIVQ